MRKVGRIRDVAKETGLSVATVSRVMNNAGNVRAETRKRVLSACEKLDYLPNPAARALSTKRTKTVAAIIPTIEHSVFAKYINAIEKALNTRGYSLVLAISNADRKEEFDAARKLIGMGADAFILSGADHEAEMLKLFNRRNIPYVYTSIWDPDCENSTIGYDNFELARKAVEYLVSCGHQKIAAVHGPLAESDRTHARKAGAQAFKSSATSIDFFECELSVSGGKSISKSILSRKNEYTAILCFSDVLAMGAYFCCQEMNVKIPDEISIMGFDNLEWSQHIVPALTTIDLPAADMGRSVADELMDHLESGNPIAPNQLFGRILKRGSVSKI